MIYDCFSFYNELDILKLRCEEMKDLDVMHILVESTHTFSGKEKPLIFEQNKKHFEKYNIVSVKTQPPVTEITWDREQHQRDCIMETLKYVAVDPDIIIVSDVDEIPKAKTISDFIEHEIDNEITFMMMDCYYYYLNFLTSPQTWTAGFISKYGTLKDKSPHQIRCHFNREKLLPNAGWHYGWMGGENKIIEKLHAFSHQELNIPENNDIEKIKRGMEDGFAFWGNEGKYFKQIEINETNSPEYLVRNFRQFQHMIK